MMSVSESQMLSDADASLVRLYMTACFSQWDKLAPIARDFYAAGGSVAELRGCVRHLIVLAGYGPCLAAMLALQKAKLLPEDSPAKVGGPPGDAFELVYGSVTDAVRRKVHSSDPGLGEWIRRHLYGDVYSSPGLDLRRKQLLMCARLAEANMQEQLFGHALAALRFGNSRAQLEEGLGLAFSLSPVPKDQTHAEALKCLALAAAKYEKDFGGAVPCSPEVHNPDPSSVLVPTLYARHAAAAAAAAVQNTSAPASTADAAAARRGAPPELAQLDADSAEDVLFAWEEVDPRFDPVTRTWRE